LAGCAGNQSSPLHFLELLRILLRGGTIDILKALNDKRREYQQQINTIDAAIKLFIGEVGNKKAKRTVSAAAKRKMSLAAKKRWAEKKKAK
jgi:hypothetical protein